MKPDTARVFEPEFIERLKEIFERRIVFNEVLGLRIDALEADGVSGHIDMQPQLIGHYAHQRLHGGVISASLDAMGGLAVMAAIGLRHLDEAPQQRLARFAKLGTIDLRVDYLRPGIGDRFEDFVMCTGAARAGSGSAGNAVRGCSRNGSVLIV